MRLKVFTKKSCKYKHGGYTIIELVIAIGLLGMVLSMSMIRCDVDKYELDNMVNELCTDLRIMSLRSSYTGTSCQIYFNKRNYEIIYGRSTVKKVNLKEGVYAVSNIKNTSYNCIPDSMAPEKGFSIYIYSFKLNDGYKVTVLPNTARVISQEGLGERQKIIAKKMIKGEEL